MRRAKRGQHLEADLGRPLRRERAVVTYDIAERTVRKPERSSLEYHPGSFVVFDDVEDDGNVGMVEPGRPAGLPEGTLVRGLLARVPGVRRHGNRPDRHVTVQKPVTGEPDNPHIVPAEYRPEPIPGGEDAAGLSTTHVFRIPGTGAS